MANLRDNFSDAAVQEQQGDGQKTVAPAFNRAVTEKDAMTEQTASLEPAAPDSQPILVTLPSNPRPVASEPEALETARIVVPREDLSDEAFAAVKRGDAQKLKSLLESGLDANAVDATGVTLLDRAVERYTVLKRAADDNETEGAQDELLKKLDPDARADAGLAALVLAGANGNVDIAKLILEEMEDEELDDDDDDLAEEVALAHNNMSVFLAIQARKHQRHEFNQRALDQNEGKREQCKEKSHQSFGEWISTTYQSAAETFREDRHAVAETIKKDAKAVSAAFGRAAHAVSHVTSDVCHAAMAFCSTFFHFNTQTPPAPPAADENQVSKNVEAANSFINRLFNFDNINKR